MGIKAVIFDMDGLLFDTENLYISESKKLVESMGYHIPDEAYLECVGASHERTRAILVENIGSTFPVDEWERDLHQRVIKHLETEGVEKKTGVDSLLAILKEHAIPLAVASSTHRKSVEGLLRLGGIRNFFSHLVCGDEVVDSKPNPEIFLKAAAAVGFSADDCLVFEDSFQGIRAAHAAGMRAVMVPDLQAPDKVIEGLCFRICSSLAEAEKDLEELLG